jgi:hypothetical protein
LPALDRVAYDSAVKTTRWLACTLGVALALLPVAAPEHMHEAEEHGHVHPVVHRHLTPHAPLDHRSAHRASLDDDDDGPALTLSTIFHVPPVFAAAIPVRTAEELLVPPPPRRIERRRCDLEILIHGPPCGPTGLRAPPDLPAV